MAQKTLSLKKHRQDSKQNKNEKKRAKSSFVTSSPEKDVHQQLPFTSLQDPTSSTFGLSQTDTTTEEQSSTELSNEAAEHKKTITTLTLALNMSKENNATAIELFTRLKKSKKENKVVLTLDIYIFIAYFRLHQSVEQSTHANQARHAKNQEITTT